MLFNTGLGGVIVRNDRLTRLALVAVVMLGLGGLMFMTVDPEIQYTVDGVMESP